MIDALKVVEAMAAMIREKESGSFAHVFYLYSKMTREQVDQLSEMTLKGLWEHYQNERTS